MHRNSFIFFFFYIASISLQAQTFLPDRPAFTKTAVVLPAGSLQFESFLGASWDKNQAISTKQFIFNSSLIRYSIADAFEIRAGWTLKNENVKSGGQEIYNESGFQPMVVGIKTPLLSQVEMGIDMAFLAHLELPFFASAAFQSKEVAPNMVLAVSHDLYSRMRIGYNIGLQWNGENPAPSAIYSACFHLNIMESLGTFGEFYVTIPKEGRDNYTFDFGLSYLINATFQIDASLGFGLDSGTQDGFFNFGASYRIDAKN